MTDVAIPVLGLAVLDSVNPSALIVTIYMLTQPDSRIRIPVYIIGIFVFYFCTGVLLLLGLDVLLSLFGELLDHPTTYALQGILGIGMLIYAVAADNKYEVDHTTQIPGAPSLAAVFLLGITITAVEFTTAVPYLGAIGLMTTADLPFPQALTLLLVYNCIFVLPPLFLFIVASLFNRKLDTTLERLKGRLQKGAHEAFLWIIGIIGFFLLMDALRYFEFFGLLDLSLQ